MSFCIMLTLNQASSGISRTKGPRYLSIGDAMTLWSSASTATSLSIPSFSARRRPSQNATIWTCRLRLMAIFISSAWPFEPMRMTVGPMSRRIASTSSKASSSPPTMIERRPSSSVLTLPETGASSMRAPSSATCSARARLASGVPVVMST